MFQGTGSVAGGGGRETSESISPIPGSEQLARLGVGSWRWGQQQAAGLELCTACVPGDLEVVPRKKVFCPHQLLREFQAPGSQPSISA